jgi:hypothetical protein
MSEEIKQEVCYGCGVRFNAKPHNATFTSGGCQNKHGFHCDGCIILKAKKLMIDGLKTIAHELSFDDIQKLVNKRTDNG